MADIGDTVADSAQDFERRHDFTGGVNGNVEPAARQRADALGDALGRHAGPGQPFRPGGDHPPFLRLRARNPGRGERAGGEAGEQALARRRLERLPDVAGRLALEAAQVRERVPHGRAGRDLGHVRPQRIVEVDHHRVPQLEDRDGGERLGGGADSVDVIGRGVLGARDVRPPERGAPEHLAVAKGRSAERGHALLGLRRRRDPVEPLDEPVRRRHALRAPPARARLRGRSPRRPRRGASRRG